MNKRVISCLVLALMVTCIAYKPSYADSLKEIPKVKLEVKVTYGGSSDDYKHEITVDVPEGNYVVTDYEILNDDVEYTEYTTSRLKIYLEADDEYKFKSPTNKYFSFTGTKDTEYISSKRKGDDGESLELICEIPPKNGKIGEASNLSWQGKTATWVKAYKASKYEVTLLKGDSVVDTQTVSGTQIDYSSLVTQYGAGKYRFKIVAQNTGYKSKVVMSGYADLNENTEQASPDNSISKWNKDDTGWWYSYGSGGYAKSKWELINNLWYYFEDTGYMKTGWLNAPEGVYYLNDNGDMATGVQLIGDTEHEFSSSGLMVR